MTAQNIEKIGALFPNCITETVDENGKPKKAINFELLRQMLSGDVIEGDEAYEFTWVGKKAAIVEANKPIRKTLRPCKEESVDWDNTENLYIEGDNLEVLKLLQESYLGKVKMIYIDPCMGSGHILVVLFDVLVQIYEAYGYSAREAAAMIVDHNLWGLDIDERAAQLSYFAVMMKARQYDRRFFSRKVQPHVYAIVESNDVDSFTLDYFVNGDANLKKSMSILMDELHNAKEYGSILNVTPVDFPALYARLAEVEADISMHRESALNTIRPLVQVAGALAQKYSVTCTNLPYMGNMPVKMTEYVQKNYSDAKYDLYAVFIEKTMMLTRNNGFSALITQHSWMFISSFIGFRKKLMRKEYISLLHLGTRAFEEIGDEVVQTVSMIFRNSNISKANIVASRLVDCSDAESKERTYLAQENFYVAKQENFELLPGNPIVYWLPNEYFDAFRKTNCVGELVERKAGVVTGNDNYFLRFWYEPNLGDISFCAKSPGNYAKYHVMSKGGSARRFYGNYEYVIRLRDLYDSSKTNASVRRGDQDYYFKKAIGWSQVGNAQKTFRTIDNSVCGTATPTIYFKQDKYYCYVLGFLNTKIAYEYLTAFNPTINLLTTDICNLPLYIEENSITSVTEIVEASVLISRTNWDSYETSWDFKHHSMLSRGKIADAYTALKADCESRFLQLKANEEELNRIFIDIYGLQEELTPDVADKDVTVHRIFDTKDEVPGSMKGSNYVRTMRDEVVSLISYAVGCMFGRYSLDVDGLAYAGGEWDASKYQTFMPDKDNIIPICDDDYFDDDITGRFIKWVEMVYGADTLEENLKFIADALGGKGSAREIIRNYFINDFYADHLKTYQKRPIYWLFDSGKKGGFKALIYMHRYQPDTIARIRTDYVHEQQSRYRTAIADLQQRINGASTGDRVKLTKQLTKLEAQAEEIRTYEEKIHHLADQMIPIDLDDGVKVNYAKFADVLAKIK